MSNRKLHGFASTAAASILMVWTGLCASADASAESRHLEFDVYLDESRIGSHRFEIRGDADGVREVRSEAEFDVKFLFFTAFRYRHENQERWVDGCLAELDADTNSNGKMISVSGERTDGNFIVQRPGEKDALPRCVMTFAYWNPAFLDQPRLLNPQTGEYLDVEVEKVGTETIGVNGEKQRTDRYRVRARGVDVNIWYTQDKRWVALESTVKGGRRIRYELS